MTDLVKLDITQGLATLTLARPEAGNAMNWDMVADLGTATGTLANDRSVRAVLIRAEGKNFSVGGDLKAFAAAADPADFIGRLADAMHVSIRRLADLPAPVVVAVQGAAAGGGLGLAISGDIVLADPGASFSMAYSGVGLTADGGATWYLPRLIGLRRTQELAYTNRRLSAEEAERHGLVTRVVTGAPLDQEARATAEAIATGPTAAFAAVKRLLATGDKASLADQLAAESASMRKAMQSPDAQGAVRAFLAREKPTFAGR